jgi:hypothetical protein
MNSKKILSLLLAFILLLSAVQSLAAKDNVIDYKKFVGLVKKIIG